MKPKILVIDDDKDLLFILEQIFDGQGYSVITACDGEDGIAKYNLSKPDLVLIDRIMPTMDGIEVVREIRKTDSKTPILFLTSKIDEEDVIAGLEAGGNDYIRKPFLTKELVARVNNFIKFNSPSVKEDKLYTIGEYKLDTIKHTLSYHGKGQPLTYMESKLLELLVKNKNKDVTNEMIISTLWAEGKRDAFSITNLHVHIHNLKNHLSKDPSLKIINMRSVGYMLSDTEIS